MEQLDVILLKKIKQMEDLRLEVLKFYKNIKTEQLMNQIFHENKPVDQADDAQ